MEFVGMALVILIIIGAGAGVAALINSYLMQKSLFNIIRIQADLYKVVYRNHDEIRQHKKEHLSKPHH